MRFIEVGSVVPRVVFLALWLAVSACGGATGDGRGGARGDGAGGAQESGAASGGALLGTGGIVSEPLPSDCAALSQTECAAERTCQRLIALSVDIGRRCWEGPPVYHGCHARGCPASFTVAQDFDNELWLFSDGCLPEGWTQVKTIVADECER